MQDATANPNAPWLRAAVPANAPIDAAPAPAPAPAARHVRRIPLLLLVYGVFLVVVAVGDPGTTPVDGGDTSVNPGTTHRETSDLYVALLGVTLRVASPGS